MDEEQQAARRRTVGSRVVAGGCAGTRVCVTLSSMHEFPTSWFARSWFIYWIPAAKIIGGSTRETLNADEGRLRALGKKKRERYSSRPLDDEWFHLNTQAGMFSKTCVAPLERVRIARAGVSAFLSLSERLR